MQRGTRQARTFARPHRALASTILIAALRFVPALADGGANANNTIF
jgi:hypothetical protein